ncbi:hypothetical protein M569_05020 [Genlisea aurea]|uniref:Dienelactone hydrolase domain-containing protein n=1 Tax=Genlisea aurea TaxID=192259 RepID=S8CSF8_9LAMI|nr:hypothetical protein M569_05020 [Genlisea aurea]
MAGAQCCENPPELIAGGSAAGSVEEFGGLSSYVSGPADSGFAVLLVSDVFGYEAPNLRKLADKIGDAGFFAVVPDLFRGDPFAPEKSGLGDWIKGHGTDKGFEDAKPVVEALKAKGVAKIGAAGFCWGAKVVVELSKEAHIQAAVLLHPSFVTLEDIHGVKVPISILGAEIDKASPPELLIQFEAALKSKAEVDSFVKIFPGVGHGWSIRYDVSDAEAVKRAEEAHADLLQWLHKHLN